MSIKKIKLLVLMILLSHWGNSMAHGEALLYHTEVNTKSKQGKDFVMTLDELARNEKDSILKVKHTSGTSVASAMFVMKGAYEIAKIRKSKYFVNLKEWTDAEGNWLYKIGFVSDNKVDPKTYFGRDIDFNKNLEFDSVDELDFLWGKK